MKDDKVYLQQILESSDKIRKFTDGLSRDQFFIDEKTQSAVIMQLALIGELTKRVTPAIQSKWIFPHLKRPCKHIGENNPPLLISRGLPYPHILWDVNFNFPHIARMQAKTPRSL